MPLNELVQKAHATAVRSGWHEGYKNAVAAATDETRADIEAAFVGAQFALIASEASEGLEAYRARGFETWQREDGKPEGVDSELADIVIRVADFCGRYNIDLQKIVEQKMAFNETRSYRHGGKRL